MRNRSSKPVDGCRAERFGGLLLLLVPQLLASAVVHTRWIGRHHVMGIAGVFRGRVPTHGTRFPPERSTQKSGIGRILLILRRAMSHHGPPSGKRVRAIASADGLCHPRGSSLVNPRQHLICIRERLVRLKLLQIPVQTGCRLLLPVALHMKHRYEMI